MVTCSYCLAECNMKCMRSLNLDIEGHIMSLIQSTPLYSSAAVIVEILDIDNKEGKEYLVKNGLPPGLSEKVAEYTGGRRSSY